MTPTPDASRAPALNAAADTIRRAERMFRAAKVPNADGRLPRWSKADLATLELLLDSADVLLAGRRQDKERIERLETALIELRDAGYEHLAGQDKPDALAAAVQKAARLLSPLSPEWFAEADAALADKEDTPNG